MSRIEMIILDSEDEYRELFHEAFLLQKHALDSIPVSFSEADFDHIFFEKDSNGDYTFSKRRAKRMMFIKHMLTNVVQCELMFQEDRGTFALFCPDLECVVYLRSRVGTGHLQIGTFFDFGKDRTKMLLKQKKKCVSITFEELKAKL